MFLGCLLTPAGTPTSCKEALQAARPACAPTAGRFAFCALCLVPSSCRETLLTEPSSKDDTMQLFVLEPMRRRSRGAVCQPR